MSRFSCIQLSNDTIGDDGNNANGTADGNVYRAVDDVVDYKQREIFLSSSFDDNDVENNNFCCSVASCSLFQTLEGNSVSINTDDDTVDDGLICCPFLCQIS